MVRYLEELLDDEGRLDGCDAAGRDEEDVCVSFAPVACCGKVRWHVSSYLDKFTEYCTLGVYEHTRTFRTEPTSTHSPTVPNYVDFDSVVK